MSDTRQPSSSGETQFIHVRYWASARSAAGVDSDALPVDAPLRLSEVLRRVGARHPDARFARVVDVCSILVGDRPVSTEDADDVVVPVGASVELLPPFAGG